MKRLLVVILLAVGTVLMLATTALAGPVEQAAPGIVGRGDNALMHAAPAADYGMDVASEFANAASGLADLGGW